MAETRPSQSSTTPAQLPIPSTFERATFLHFPDEVLSLVATQLVMLNEREKGRLHDLGRFCRVSRRLYGIANPVLFRSVELRAASQHWEKGTELGESARKEKRFTSAIVAKPGLLAHLRELSAVWAKGDHSAQRSFLFGFLTGARVDLRRLVLSISGDVGTQMRLAVISLIQSAAALHSLALQERLDLYPLPLCPLAQNAPLLRELRLRAMVNVFEDFHSSIKIFECATYTTLGPERFICLVESGMNLSILVELAIPFLFLQKLRTHLVESSTFEDRCSPTVVPSLQKFSISGVDTWYPLRDTQPRGFTLIIDLLAVLHLWTNAPLQTLCLGAFESDSMRVIINHRTTLATKRKCPILTLDRLRLVFYCQRQALEGEEGFNDSLIQLNNNVFDLLEAFPYLRHLELDGYLGYFDKPFERLSGQAFILRYPVLCALLEAFEQSDLLSVTMNFLRCSRQTSTERFTREYYN